MPWPCHSSKGDAGQGLMGSERMSTSLPRESGRPWSRHTLTMYPGLGGLLSTSMPGLLYCPHVGHGSPESYSKHLLVFPLMPLPRNRPHSPRPLSPSFCYAGAPSFFPAPLSATSPPKPVQEEALPAEPEGTFSTPRRVSRKRLQVLQHDQTQGTQRTRTRSFLHGGL